MEKELLIEYSYLAGALEGTLRYLSYDLKFQSLKTEKERAEYIENLIVQIKKTATDLAKNDPSLK